LHGQSAGGASVDYYSYAWTEDLIVSGFIPQSRSAALRIPANVTGDPSIAAVSQWSKLSQKLGCDAVTPQDVAKSLSCMRSKSLKEVMDATAPSTTAAAMGSWGPKTNGKTVFEDLADRGAKGKFIKAVRKFSQVMQIELIKYSLFLSEIPTTRVKRRLVAKQHWHPTVVLVVQRNCEKMLVFPLGGIFMLRNLRTRRKVLAVQTLKAHGMSYATLLGG
jgi:hypothetical protein